MLSAALAVLLAIAAADPPTHELRRVEGFTVHVDVQLLRKKPDLAEDALRLLRHELFGLTIMLPADRVDRLRDVPIWLDLDREGLRNVQYHPSRQWLVEHHHDPRLARCVHIPQARYFVDLVRGRTQPAVLIHEYAHVYHDQVLGFDHRGILEAYHAAVDAESYEKVLHVSGQERAHYALTDHKEYFAEATEAFFSSNDFYPFVRPELARHDPTLYRLLEQIWLGR